MTEPFSEDYYLRGRELGLSCYDNYSWHPEMTVPTAHAIVDLFPRMGGSRVLDFGCARGYLVRALREMRVDAWGVDCSTWAIDEGADPTTWGYLCPTLDDLPSGIFGYLIAKDVFEHVPPRELLETLLTLGEMVTDGAIVIVPVTRVVGGPYISPDEERDPSHCIRWPSDVWEVLLRAVWPSWSFLALPRLAGIKDHRATSEGYRFFVGRKP